MKFLKYWILAALLYAGAVFYVQSVDTWFVLLDFKFWAIVSAATFAAVFGDVLRYGAAVGGGCGCLKALRQ